MIKGIIKLYNTRYIWMITQMLQFDRQNKLTNKSEGILINIAFSHGARDCQTYRVDKKGDNNIHNCMENIDYKDVITFIQNEVKYIIFDNIENKNDIEFTEAKIEQYTIIINDSTFLPVLSLAKPDEYTNYKKINIREDNDQVNNLLNEEEFKISIKTEKTKMHNVGFLYTQFYLLGFFYGLRHNLRQDLITSNFHYDLSKGLCIYDGYTNNKYYYRIYINNNHEDINLIDFLEKKSISIDGQPYNNLHLLN